MASNDIQGAGASQVVALREARMPAFPDKKESNPPDWREYLDQAWEGQRLDEEVNTSQEVAHIHIDTDRPVAVLYTGDWHLGANSTDYTRWYEDLLLILDTPDLYMIDLGDDYQNMRSFKSLSAVLSQVLTPIQQTVMIKGVIDELTAKNKLLAKIGGNHDMEFDERLFGQALQGYLYENCRAPLFENRGLVYLKIGQEVYPNLLFHKSRFKSILRPAHGAFREWQSSYPAEVVAGGHDHTPAFEIMWGYTWAQANSQSFGGQVFLIKVGSYQGGDFGYRYFSNGGFPVNPTVVYFPQEHKKLAFMDPRDAIQFMNSYSRNGG